MFALAAFADCKGVVDFFGAFIEDNRLYMQLELCNGHINVDDVPLLQMKRPAWTAEMVAQVATTLACMHARGAAHLDVKPENILTAIDHNKARKAMASPQRQHDGSGGGGAAAAAAAASAMVMTTAMPAPATPVYKLGDLGLTQRTGSQQFEVADGDDRYLSLDLMNGSQHLCAADVFALGVSAYHLVLKLAEPPSGEWKDIRERGVLRSLSGRILPQGNNFRELLEAMVHPDPTMRPSAQEVADRARAYVGECDAAAAVASGVPSEQGRVAELDAKCDALGMELDAARREKVAMQERMQKMQVHYEGQMKALQGQMQQAQAQVRQAQVQVQQVQAQAQAQVQQVQAQAQAQAHAKPKKKKDRFGAFRKVKGGSSAATAPLMASRRGGVGSSSTSLASRLGAALEEDDIGGY